jgi:hypothetical protein
MSLSNISPYSGIRIWDLENGREQRIVDREGGLTQTLFLRNEWSRQSQFLDLGQRQVDPLMSISDSKNGPFEVMDIETGEILETVDADEDDLNSRAGTLINYKSAGPMVISALPAKICNLALSLPSNRPVGPSIIFHYFETEKEQFKTKAVSSNAMLSGMDEAFERFKSHPVYQTLFAYGIFSNEDSMKSFYKNAVLRGTCDSQIEEMCRLLDVDSDLDSLELQLNINPVNVCFNQIVSFTKSEIGKVITKEESSGTLSKDRKKSLWLMIEILQTSMPHQHSLSLTFNPDINPLIYKTIYKKFMTDQVFSNYSPYGRIFVSNIVKHDPNGCSTTENHAIFFQDLKTKGSFRFYEPNDGFSELAEEEFFETLREQILIRYGDEVSVCFSIDTNEINYPAISPLAKLNKLVLKRADQREIESAFSLLTPGDQSLIYQMVCKYAEHTFLDLQWGKGHVFDSRLIFDCAVSNAIIFKYNELPLSSRILTVEKVCQLSGLGAYSLNFSQMDLGMEYLFKNLLMLADAMDMI